MITSADTGFVEKKRMNLLTKYGVFSEEELHARYEVEIEKYCKEILIEARVLKDMARTIVLPAALEHQRLLLENFRLLKESGVVSKNLFNETKIFSNSIEKLISAEKTLDKILIKCEKQGNLEKCAEICSTDLCDNMMELRNVCDFIENQASDRVWSLPKYSELLFVD